MGLATWLSAVLWLALVFVIFNFLAGAARNFFMIAELDGEGMAIIAVTGDDVESLLHRVGQPAELVVAQLFQPLPLAQFQFLEQRKQ